MNIISALHDSRLFLPCFKDISTWRSWEVFLKALFALPIQDEEELKLFQKSTNLTEPPKERAKEAWAICGRRSGKSFTSALIACWLATSRNWREVLSPGETGMIFILSVDKYQSSIIRNYVSAILNSSEAFKRLIRCETVEGGIELQNQVQISIKSASFRSLRGFQLLACLCDEISFWRDLETGANPAGEILRSIRPGLVNTNGLLLAISTPYSRSGSLYQAYRDNFGRAGGPLVWKAPSVVMNPTLDRDRIEAEIASDPEAGKSEWEAEFRSDLSAFIPAETLEVATIPARFELGRVDGLSYAAFTDPSGGRSDSFTLAISHKGESGRIILDCLIERASPFSPENVVQEYSAVLKAYGLSEVVGDKYSAEFVVELFRKCGIAYQASERTSSEIYLEFLPLLTSGKIELLDVKRLRAQLTGLERRTRTSGKDLVGHYPGGHDDLAVACCGALVLAAGEVQRDDLTRIWTPPRFKSAMSEREKAKRSFLDEISGRRPSTEEAEERALEAENEKEDRELEAELRAENPSIGFTQRWKK